MVVIECEDHEVTDGQLPALTISTFQSKKLFVRISKVIDPETAVTPYEGEEGVDTTIGKPVVNGGELSSSINEMPS